MFPGVQKVLFLEKTESFYTVAADVVLLQAEIEEWMSAFLQPGAGIYSETVAWGKNVEGGLLTQRLQDALLLIRFDQQLLDESKADELHVIAEPESVWDDRVIAQVALSRGCPVFIHRAGAVRVWVSDCLARLRPWAVGTYFLLNVLRLGGGRLFKRAPADCEGRIIFQLSSSWRKHVENVAPLMKALRARGEEPLAVCWVASERFYRKSAAVQLTLEGLNAVQLERWVRLRDIAASIAQSAGIALRVRHSSRSGSKWSNLRAYGVPLAPLLQESLSHLLIAELPQRIRIQRALAACFENARPRAFKPWAGPESFDGQAALRILRATGRPFVFHYWLGASLEWPYADTRHSPDLFLAVGPYEARHAQNDYVLTGQQIVIVGQARYTGYSEFAASHSPSESRRKLGLALNGRRYIGFDPNCAIRGYQSAREQFDMATALLEAARRVPGLVIVVKPHPSYPIDHLRPLFDAAALPNVAILSRSAPLMHFLNSIDVIVTKYSTLILEAALMDRVSIAALFNSDPRFRVYGNMPEFVNSPAELTALAERIGADDAAFREWRGSRAARQAALLPDFYMKTQQQPSMLAADAILAHIGPMQNAHLSQ
jgi:hypothetical protein